MPVYKNEWNIYLSKKLTNFSWKLFPEYTKINYLLQSHSNNNWKSALHTTYVIFKELERFAWHKQMCFHINPIEGVPTDT